MGSAAVKCEHVGTYGGGSGLRYTQIARRAAEIHDCRDSLRRLFSFKIGAVISIKCPTAIQGAVAIFIS